MLCAGYGGGIRPERRLKMKHENAMFVVKNYGAIKSKSIILSLSDRHLKDLKDGMDIWVECFAPYRISKGFVNLAIRLRPIKNEEKG